MSRLKVGDRLSWPIPWRDADETTVQVTYVANGHVLVCTVLEPHACADWAGTCERGGTSARAPEDWLPVPEAGLALGALDECLAALTRYEDEHGHPSDGAVCLRTAQHAVQRAREFVQNTSPSPLLARLVPALPPDRVIADAVLAARLQPPDFGADPITGWKEWVEFGARSALDALFPEKP